MGYNTKYPEVDYGRTKNNTALKEQLRKERFTSKNDLLIWLSDAKKRISKKSETDNLHSAAFYHAYESLLNKFEEKIANTILFTYLEDCWYYELSISYSEPSYLYTMQTMAKSEKKEI